MRFRCAALFLPPFPLRGRLPDRLRDRLRDDFDAEVFRGVRASVRSCRGIVATCGV